MRILCLSLAGRWWRTECETGLLFHDLVLGEAIGLSLSQDLYHFICNCLKQQKHYANLCLHVYLLPFICFSSTDSSPGSPTGAQPAKPDLPLGVTERDVELFRQAQEKAMMVIVPDYKVPPPGVSWLCCLSRPSPVCKRQHVYLNVHWNLKEDSLFCLYSYLVR